ncbi:flagellar hook capping FlgD N-terminal domain-containing protein [Microbacteriaceae bacterium 4G12]
MTNVNLNGISNTSLPQNNQTASPTSGAAGSILNKDDFLKMFLTSLQYQDPFNAMDMNQMMSQMSQMSLIEGVQNMTKAVETLTKSSQTTALDSGMKFLGKSIKGVDTNGNVTEGKVDQVRLAPGTVQLIVGGHIVPLQSVVSVSENNA